MLDLIAAILTLLGSLLIFLAAIGLLKLPDFYIRMSVITKAATLGVGLILVGAGFYFDLIGIIVKLYIIILLILLTTPVSGHLGGKIASRYGVEFHKSTVLKEFYDYLNKNRKEHAEIKERIISKNKKDKR